MTTTPWGEAAELREKRLNPGLRLPPEEVARSQRERLFGALVATVAEKGYEATSVADLLELSGVSRASFYELFAGKDACFLAALRQLVDQTVSWVEAREAGPGAGLEGTRAMLEAFIGLVVHQAAAARMCFVDIYAAGPEAIGAMERSFDAFEAFVAGALKALPEHEGMPPELVRGVMGGLQKVIHTRLYRGEEETLVDLTPDLWAWGSSYLPPPQPLRRPRRRRPAARDESADEPAERLLRALAQAVLEKGYPATTVAEVVERASSSERTFYRHFDGREDAILAALDRGSSQMLAAILPAFRRAPDWPRAVRLSFEAMFNFAARDPEYTLLGVVGVYAAGKRALEARDNIITGLGGLLMPGYEVAPDTPAVAAEAIGGAIYSLIYDQLRAGGSESLPQLTPMATYIALSPFLGAEEACKIANGDGRR